MEEPKDQPESGPSSRDQSIAKSSLQAAVAAGTPSPKGDDKEESTPVASPTSNPNNGSKPSDIPLHAKWTLWYDNPRLAPAGADWKESLKPCGSFDSVGCFWSIFNNLKPATQISVSSNYSVFRYGVEPSWEEAANVNGGKFVLTIPKKESKAGKVNEWWLFTVLALIGETMDATGDQVNGAVVSIRKSQDRIALWLKSSDRQVCVKIGLRWKLVLNLDKITVRYQTHKDAAASGRSFRNDVQFVV